MQKKRMLLSFALNEGRERGEISREGKKEKFPKEGAGLLRFNPILLNRIEKKTIGTQSSGQINQHG